MPNRSTAGLWLSFAAGLALSSAPAGGADPPSTMALQVLDEQVLTLGHRIAVRGKDLCAAQQWHPGFAVHDLSQYAGAARRELAASGLDAGPRVLALVPDGPAARAGLRRDDILVAVDGQMLPKPPRAVENSFVPAERIIDAIERGFIDGRARLAIVRAGGAQIIEISAQIGCATRFQVVPSRRLNAYADGRYVQLTSGIAAFAADEQELAALVAHELSHNILRHRDRLNAAGIERGLLQSFGRNGRLSRQTEIEADRYAVYLLARAGFDPRGAVRFWARLAPRSGSLFAGTHPRWRDRIAAIEAEITQLERILSAGGEIRPAWAPAALR